MRRSLLALTAVAALSLAACAADDPEGGGGSEEATSEAAPSESASTPAAEGSEATTSEDAGGVPADGPTITVASFNFPESEILANVYGQALEGAGYPVEYELGLGSRELIFPELTNGSIGLLPEYVGGALSSGFGEEATSDLDASLQLLTDTFEAEGVTVLEAAPGTDEDVFVVTQEFADENDVAAIPDLADAGDLTLGGPPECEQRDLCFLGLTEGPYELGNLSFTGIGEGSVRIASLQSGDVDVATLFSTDPVIEQNGWIVLEDPEGLTPAQNIVPVVADDVAEAYGQEMVDLVNSISEAITTEALVDLRTRVEIDAESPDDVAAAFLEENGLTG